MLLSSTFMTLAFDTFKHSIKLILDHHLARKPSCCLYPIAISDLNKSSPSGNWASNRNCAIQGTIAANCVSLPLNDKRTATYDTGSFQKFYYVFILRTYPNKELPYPSKFKEILILFGGMPCKWAGKEFDVIMSFSLDSVCWVPCLAWHILQSAVIH